MKNIRGRRVWTLILALCMIVGLLPLVSFQAKAYSGVESLDCSDFISNDYAKNYINTMMRHYINNYSELQWDLNNGYSVVFMFEGGSDNYTEDGVVYQDAAYTTRTQAVCIVVQTNSSGKVEIVFSSEYCSSIPDDANWTSGGAYDNSTTLMDGMYEMYTCNHNGSYAAFTTSASKGWYSPYDDGNGWINSANGINIHTRGADTCGGQSAGYAQSAGCQLIGFGASSGNSFNAFMKTVAGITWNSYAETRNTFSSTGAYKGTYVVDRQLGLVNPSGTEYGSGSLRTLYSEYDLDNITAFSTSARANADFTTDYASQCESYPAHCRFTTSKSTPINTQPCSAGNNESETLQTLTAGTTLTAIGLYQNGAGNLWYQVETADGTTGYVYSGHTTYDGELTSDITISGASSPNGHVAGNIFYVQGNIASKYNKLTGAAVWIHSGFGTSGSKVTGGSDTVSGNSYTLINSAIDNATAFNEISTGKYTYAVSADYTNYYAATSTTLGTNTGKVYLLEDYFVVIASETDQSTCSHSYSTTVVKAATCGEAGSSVKSCSKCGYIVEQTDAPISHDYGSWNTTAATCTEAGSRSRSCSNCGDVQTETIQATGHSYHSVTTPADCQNKAYTTYTCANCGDNFTITAGQWSEYAPTDVDAALVASRQEYRYSDYETVTSYETSLDGYTLKGSAWIPSGTGAVQYVKSWPSGFSTSSSLYTKYDKAGSKVSNSETATTKTTVTGDEVCGYLWYHWCYSGSYYSSESKSGSYTTFHAYYDTTDPSNFTCDTSDNSYQTSHSTCSNSEWWFYTEVYQQDYTTYNKQFTYERWTDWSDWSAAPATASDTRKVETRTTYSYTDTGLGDHNYVNGICSVCGESDPDYEVKPELFDIPLASMTMGNSLAINFAFEKSNADDWTGCYAGIVKTYSDGREDVVETVPAANWKSTTIGGEAYYYVTFNGIAAKEMSDEVYVTIYNASGEAISNTKTDSVRDQSMRTLVKAGVTDKEKTMVVDMLNYGAAAQDYFGYGTDDLANNQLNDAQKAYASQPKACTNTRTGSGNFVASTVVLKSNIQMMFAFKNIDESHCAVVTFTNHRGSAKTISVSGSDFTTNGSAMVVTVDALVVADGRQDVTCVVYNSSGTEVARVTDSLESYTARANAENELFIKMMQYSDSAYAYFHT